MNELTNREKSQAKCSFFQFWSFGDFFHGICERKPPSEAECKEEGF